MYLKTVFLVVAFLLKTFKTASKFLPNTKVNPNPHVNKISVESMHLRTVIFYWALILTHFVFCLYRNLMLNEHLL